MFGGSLLPIFLPWAIFNFSILQGLQWSEEWKVRICPLWWVNAVFFFSVPIEFKCSSLFKWPPFGHICGPESLGIKEIVYTKVSKMNSMTRSKNIIKLDSCRNSNLHVQSNQTVFLSEWDLFHSTKPNQSTADTHGLWFLVNHPLPTDKHVTGRGHAGNTPSCEKRTWRVNNV